MEDEIAPVNSFLLLACVGNVQQNKPKSNTTLLKFVKE